MVDGKGCCCPKILEVASKDIRSSPTTLPKPNHRSPYPFTGRKRRAQQSSSSDFGTFRSYAIVELKNQGYSRPSGKILTNVWLSMSQKERHPWKVLAARLNSNPILESEVYPVDSPEMEELATRLRMAAIRETSPDS